MSTRRRNAQPRRLGPVHHRPYPAPRRRPPFVRLLRGHTRNLPEGLRTALAREDGSVLPYFAVGVMVVVLIGLTVITIFGDGLAEERKASTASDAAALAAADAWADSLEEAFENALTATSDDELYSGLGATIGSYAGADVRAAASRYAEANGATITSYRVNASAGEVTVTVASNRTVNGTSTRMTSTSTARINLDSGLCVSRGRLGIEVSGTCRTSAPTRVTATATPTDDGDAEEPEYSLPAGLATTVEVSTRLVG